MLQPRQNLDLFNRCLVHSLIVLDHFDRDVLPAPLEMSMQEMTQLKTPRPISDTTRYLLFMTSPGRT